MLADGTYDAFVVDVEEPGDGTVGLSLTITTGEHKGEVVDVRTSGLEADPIDLLGLPATIVVADGAPRVTFD